MMKLVILAVLGLFVGLGGGSAVAVMKAKKLFAADTALRAKLVADSLAAAEEAHKTKPEAVAEHGDSTAADSTVGEAGKEGTKEVPKGGEHVAAKSATEAKAPAHEQVTAKSPAAHESAKPIASKAAPDSGKWNRAVETVEAHGTPSSGGAAAKPHLPPLPAKPIASTTTSAAIAPSTSKVAKIFAAMPPKDAAKVLEQLDDSDVQAIIGSVSEKQAASILQNFPPVRAAAISKAVMRTALVQP